jgi:hypothetical protein
VRLRQLVLGLRADFHIFALNFFEFERIYVTYKSSIKPAAAKDFGIVAQYNLPPNRDVGV